MDGPKLKSDMTDKKYKQIFIQGAISAALIADNIQKHTTNTSIGAHSIFLGQVRGDKINSKTVTAIEYTTYEPMALEKMHEIREAIFQKYPLTCMHIYHSLGKITTGEICLFVFTSAVHRKQAMNACEEVVERIKSELPIWGKELFEGTTHQWKENK